MKRVYVISRLRESEGRTLAQNIDLAERLARAAVLAGVSPLPPHALYTRFLNDNDPGERFLGMRAGAAWLPAAEEAWVFTRHGISSGMAEEIETAARLGVAVIEDPPCWAEIDRPVVSEQMPSQTASEPLVGEYRVATGLLKPASFSCTGCTEVHGAKPSAIRGPGDK